MSTSPSFRGEGENPLKPLVWKYSIAEHSSLPSTAHKTLSSGVLFYPVSNAHPAVAASVWNAGLAPRLGFNSLMFYMWTLQDPIQI